jgi:tellurite resistance protein
MKNITKFTKLDKISNFIFSDSDLSPNFDLLKQDKDAAEEIIDTMLVISSLDKNISQEEIEFIYEVAKMLDVKKEVIEENLINISNIEKGK